MTNLLDEYRGELRTLTRERDEMKLELNDWKDGLIQELSQRDEVILTMKKELAKYISKARKDSTISEGTVTGGDGHADLVQCTHVTLRSSNEQSACSVTSTGLHPYFCMRVFITPEVETPSSCACMWHYPIMHLCAHGTCREKALLLVMSEAVACEVRNNRSKRARITPCPSCPQGAAVVEGKSATAIGVSPPKMSARAQQQTGIASFSDEVDVT